MEVDLVISTIFLFTTNGKSCQIDLLLPRRAVYIVEIKRRRDIDADVMPEVRQKLDRLKSRTRKSIRAVPVYEGHLAPSIEADAFFDHLVPASILLLEN